MKDMSNKNQTKNTTEQITQSNKNATKQRNEACGREHVCACACKLCIFVSKNQKKDAGRHPMLGRQEEKNFKKCNSSFKKTADASSFSASLA